MYPATWDFSRTGRARAVLVTVVGTSLTIAAALAMAAYLVPLVSGPVATIIWIAAVSLPLLLSAPVIYVFAMLLRKLALANRELALIASEDSLTTVLNRGAFETLVDAYLSQVNVADDSISGGLLIIDADHFKDVNDTFGHPVGDDVLRYIAGAIKSSLRPKDLVGRIGGEEFAVFLPAVEAPYVKDIAERIRQSVYAAEGLLPAGATRRLSVSVGGTVFRGPLSYHDLFTVADSRLYQAKHNGRNRIEIAVLGSSLAA